MRTAIFLVAFVVMSTATFPDANAWLARLEPLSGLNAGLRYFLLHVPYALLAGMLFALARIGSRLPANPIWYGALGLLAVAHLCAAFVPSVYLALAKPLLVAAIVMVLLRLQPRAGSLYEATIVPGVLAFVALTLLTSMSLRFAQDFGGFGLWHPALDRMPADLGNLALAAIVAAAFIVASRIRHRSLQPCPAKPWLAAGVVVWAVAEGLRFAGAYSVYADAVRIAAHGALFVGMFYLLSHLLPRRAADEAA